MMMPGMMKRRITSRLSTMPNSDVAPCQRATRITNAANATTKIHIEPSRT